MSTEPAGAAEPPAAEATDILERWGAALRVDLQRYEDLEHRLGAALAALLTLAVLASIVVALFLLAGELHPALWIAIAGGSAGGCALIWRSLSQLRGEREQLQQRLSRQARALVEALAGTAPGELAGYVRGSEGFEQVPAPRQLGPGAAPQVEARAEPVP